MRNEDFEGERENKSCNLLKNEDNQGKRERKSEICKLFKNEDEQREREGKSNKEREREL